jgi:hypothetical protein
MRKKIEKLTPGIRMQTAVDLGYKPRAKPCIYLYNLPPRDFGGPYHPVGRGAGFSRFLLFAAGEGESLTADGPCELV